MKEIELNNPLWRHIRIILSLALMRKEPVVVKKGFEFIEKNYDLIPLYNDIKRIVFETGAGILNDSGSDIVFNPEGILYGTYNFDTDKYSSISEIELFLLPSLFQCEFRSVIHFRGVTHSHLSYPTTFLKETLFSFMEYTGHYASLNLKRFGFYGSGGGAAESRVYPAEPGDRGDIFFSCEKKIEGVRIFLARMNMEMAAREKDFVVKNTGIDGNSVQIMEVVDADGYGNSIQVYVKCGNLSVILSRDMEIYNSAGDFIFDEEKYYMTLSGLMKETDKLIRFNKLPDYLIDELLPYLFMNGSAVPDDMKNSYVYSLCRDFF
jgi:hypothetical protein